MSSDRAARLLDGLGPESRALLADALNSWAPGASLSVSRDLVGGKSGASVLLVDVADPTGQAPADLLGERILKIEKRTRTGPTEDERHQRAHEHSSMFAPRLPKLVRSYHANDRSAILYEIAGHGLFRVTTIQGATTQYATMVDVLERISEELLQGWNAGFSIAQATSARAVLEEWLDYRLKHAPLLEWIEGITEGHPVFRLGGEVLANPIHFCGAGVADAPRMASFRGLIHGDLHPGNILIDRLGRDKPPYWVIDFALCRAAPLLFDHAYLEFALLLDHLRQLTLERLFTVLRAVEDESRPLQSSPVASQDVALLGQLHAIRQGQASWQRSAAASRVDPFWAQQALARVAAGINWANKPLETDLEKRLALAYAGWYARDYLRRFCASSWSAMIEAPLPRIDASPGTPTVAAPEPSYSEWERIWEAVGRLDTKGARLVLAVGRLGTSADVASVGALPWSLIVDLDPETEQNGLLASAGPILERHRSLARFGLTPKQVNFDRGTAWLLAGGWPRCAEPVPPTELDWRRAYLAVLRDTLRTLRRETAAQTIRILVLADTLPQDRLKHLLYAIDETLGTAAKVTLLGRGAPSDADASNLHLAVDAAAFLAGLRRTFGLGDLGVDFLVPGQEGPRSLPAGELRDLEEDLAVLHSRILDDERAESTDSSEFWRGNPPTWHDLQMGLDVERDVQIPLGEELEARLAQSRNYTVELRHTPGAGGTTVALRAAWNLRKRFPTAVLQRYSEFTVDRLDRLFHLAQRPVLLVADAATLPAVQRDELYHRLTDRGARVVILWVVRTTQVDPSRALSVFDPLNAADAGRFLEVYGAQATEQSRRATLATMTSDPQWEPYRSPFFYGLVVYERQFRSVDTYVAAHVADVGQRARDVLAYLALVARYTQIGVDESVVRKWLLLRPDSTLPLEEALGAGPNRLVVRRGGRLRILHPIIAEEVIRQVRGALDRRLAEDFINAISEVLGGDSEETRSLFTNLFIRRSVWSGAEGKAAQFSEIIDALPDTEAHLVLRRLTEVCPEEAHFWNHLGRHHIHRMKLDFGEAAQLLEKAVQLAPDDAIHWHSLGMVRRFWMEYRIDRLFARGARPTPDALLDEVESLAHSAAAALERARALSPEDEHGYVTHIQLILRVAGSLVRAAGAPQTARAGAARRNASARRGGIGILGGKSARVDSWLQANLPLAEELLMRLDHLRADRDESHHVRACRLRLSALYGDLSGLITTWEHHLHSSTDRTGLRRAIATAYLARADRRWSELGIENLRRICLFMEDNLREDPGNERDLKTWFQAYRRLPEFDYLEAIQRFETWADRLKDVDVHYYLYILHFLRWSTGNEPSEEKTLERMARCREVARGRRLHSFEWYAKAPEWCPLVNYRDLGQWDRQLDFYSETASLGRFGGFIDKIDGLQAGRIRVGEHLTAFFTPRKSFSRPRDINAEVEFYLGFRYDGLHAWSVSHASSEESLGVRRPGQRLVQQRARSATSPITTRPFEVLKQLLPDASTEPEKGDGGASLRLALERDVTDHVGELMAAREARGSDLWLDELEGALADRFGDSRLLDLGDRSWRSAIRRLCSGVLQEQGERVRLVMPARSRHDRPSAAAGQSARDSASHPTELHAKADESPGARSGQSSSPRQPGRTEEAKAQASQPKHSVAPALTAVRDYLLLQLTRSEAGELGLPAAEQHISGRFGASVHVRLGFSSFKEMVSGLDTLSIEGTGGWEVVRRKAHPTEGH